jgi:hypothetical protein
MTMTPALRKFALTLHVTCSVGWLGAVVTYLVLVAAALMSHDASRVRAVWIALELTGWFAIVPLSITSLITGLIQSLGTPWGLFRHYWVLFKLLLTILATVVLLLHMPTVSYLAEGGSGTDTAHLGGLSGEIIHAGGGLLVLVVTTVLSVYKPRGLTPYGWRKQQEQRMVSPARDGVA